MELAEERKPAPGGQDQERDELVIQFGNTIVRQTKDRITARELCMTHQDFQANGDWNKPQSGRISAQFPE